MTSHDPLTMGGLLASQVQVLSRDGENTLSVSPPDVDPRGLGFTSILTQIFGLPTTLDPETQKRLDERNHLIRIEKRTKVQEERLLELSEKLKRLGFVIEDREPEYALFLRAMDELKTERNTVYSLSEISKKNEVAKQMLAEIMKKRESQ